MKIFEIIYLKHREKGKPLDFANKHFSCFASFIFMKGKSRESEINNLILDELAKQKSIQY
jgi:hypothetical protein